LLEYVNRKYGKPGDRLWVKETWIEGEYFNEEGEIWYRANDEDRECFAQKKEDGDEMKWGSALFMPKWAARILLDIVSIRVERLQDISEEDAIAEGVEYNEGRILRVDNTYGEIIRHYRDYYEINFHNYRHERARFSFPGFWDSLNAKRGYPWEKNPWVWVIEFNRVKETA